MSTKISEEVEKEISNLYSRDLTVKEIAKIVGLPYSKVYELTLLKEAGFSSITEYYEYLARRRINPDTGVKFKSHAEYQGYRAKKRQKNYKNKKLSELIINRLEKLGENQSWLAKELMVSRPAVSRYIHGQSVPKREKVNRLFAALNVHYKNLDELVNDN